MTPWWDSIQFNYDKKVVIGLAFGLRFVSFRRKSEVEEKNSPFFFFHHGAASD